MIGVGEKLPNFKVIGTYLAGNFVHAIRSMPCTF